MTGFVDVPSPTQPGEQIPLPDVRDDDGAAPSADSLPSPTEPPELLEDVSEVPGGPPSLDL